MDFNPGVALDYARSISRPRLVGSSEEERVAEEIAGQLERSGFVVDFQSFKFSTVLDLFLSAEILLSQALILATLWVNGINQWLALFLCGLLIILIFIVKPLNRKIQASSFVNSEDGHFGLWSSICWNLGRRYQTKNIVATLTDIPENPNLPHLYLVAHYDSKSQYLPLVLRFALFVIVISGSLVFSVLNVINIANMGFTPILFVIGIIVTACGIPLLFLDYGNDSPGAIDDASGVGLVLHLAEIIANNQPIIENLRFTLLITSGEELAVKGALAYIKENETNLRRQADGGDLHILNFDGIGVDGNLYLVGGERRLARSTGINLYQLVRHSAEKLGISIGRFSLPGALFDHIPFAEDGYDAVSIIGIGRSTQSIHTSNDSPDKLHFRGFDQSGRLAIGVIEKLSASKVIGKQVVNLEQMGNITR
jgi:hypothetical protein